MIVSDHGFESGNQAAAWAELNQRSGTGRREFSCCKGPGIRSDARIEGATLLDIAPTVLTLLGLPIGEDMEGKVILSAFEESPANRADSVVGKC